MKTAYIVTTYDGDETTSHTFADYMEALKCFYAWNHPKRRAEFTVTINGKKFPHTFTTTIKEHLTSL